VPRFRIVLASAIMKRSYCPELDDPFQVFDLEYGGFFAARTRYSIGILFDTREKAETHCDHMNAFTDLHRRKDEALDWALENEGRKVTCEEIEVALRSPDCVGLLAFEQRMGDSPVVVG